MEIETEGGGGNLAAPKGTHHHLLPLPPWIEGWKIEVATSLKREKFEEIIRSSVRSKVLKFTRTGRDF